MEERREERRKGEENEGEGGIGEERKGEENERRKKRVHLEGSAEPRGRQLSAATTRLWLESRGSNRHPLFPRVACRLYESISSYFPCRPVPRVR
jgi:hypothetical protein